MRGNLELRITAATPLSVIEEHLVRLGGEAAWLNRLSAMSEEEDAALTRFLEDSWVLIARMRRRSAREAAYSIPAGEELRELACMVRIVLTDIDIVYRRLLA